MSTERRKLTVARERSLETITNDALSVLGDQIERYRIKSGQGYALEDNEVKNLKQLISALAELGRESRERDKADELAKLLPNMSDQELLDYAAKKLLK